MQTQKRFIFACLMAASSLGLFPRVAGAAALVPLNPGMELTCQFVNNSAYPNSQVYILVMARDAGGVGCYLNAAGALVPIVGGQNTTMYSMTLSSFAGLQFPPTMTAGRLWIAYGAPLNMATFAGGGVAQPNINNPGDPNINTPFDWMEFTVGGGSFFGNTTQVDMFGIPYTMSLYDDAGAGYSLNSTQGIPLCYNDVLSQYHSFMHSTPGALPFDSLAGPLRIVAPIHGSFAAGQPNGNYFDAYIAANWGPYAGTLAMPSTQDVFGATGSLATQPVIDASLNRHVINTGNVNNPAAYYQNSPANYYSDFWHQISLNSLAYGFPYDDSNNQSSLQVSNHPRGIVITLSGCQNTPTASPSATPSATRSRTPTVTPTATRTPTRTATPSTTPTASPSASKTATPSQTRSRTGTPSSSATATSSPTATVTRTATPTATLTASRTSSSSPTASPTLSASPSSSVTATQTPSRTPSPTPTSSASASPSQSPTATSSPTATLSGTPSATASLSATRSASATASPTLSQSATASATASVSPTSSATQTPSASSTRTASPTASPTLSATASSTQSLSPSATRSSSPSPSATPTPTLSFTPPPSQGIPSFTHTPQPMLFQVSVGAYSSSGERIRSLYQGPASVLPGTLVLDRATLDLGGALLQIAFPGTLSGGLKSLAWDGGNDSGQSVSTGIYYIKMDSVDPFGKSTSLIVAVQVIDARPVQYLSVFNSAGERLRQIPLPTGLALNGLSLGADTLIVGGAAPAALKVDLHMGLGQSYSSSWDGKNDAGAYVASGIYSIVLVSRQGPEEARVVSKSVQVLRAPEEDAASLARPLLNPLPATQRQLSIVYPAQAGQRGSLSLYSLAGEMVGRAGNSGQAGQVSIDCGRLGAGIYVARLEIKDGTRVTGRKSIKVVLLR